MNKLIHAVFGKKNKFTPSISERAPHPSYGKQYITKSSGGWDPVGFDEKGHYVILSRKTGGLMTLSPKSMDESTLRAAVGSQYCEQEHAEFDRKLEKNIFCPSSLALHIREACDELGPVDLGKVRTPGFYETGGKLVVHFGDEVYESNGTPVDTAPGEAIYVTGKGLGFSFETPAATAEDVRQLEDAVQGFNFRNPFDSVAVLGWLVTAVFGAVVKHRPILAVTAERGSGKTTLIELLSALLGPQAIQREGVPTVAQVIYELENRSAALLVDEFEAAGSKKQAVENFLGLCRDSFTKSGFARIARVYAGKSRYFNSPAGVLVAGIALPAFDEAADSRTVRIQMQPLPVGAKRVRNLLLDPANQSDVHQFGARMRRLLVGRWDVFAAAQCVVRELLIERGHTTRAADKFSPLVAGYVALVNEALPSRQQLEALLDVCQLSRPEVAEVERDCETCLSLLLNRRVVIFHEVGEQTVKSHERIRDVLQCVVASDGDAETRMSLVKQLEKFGLRPMWKAATKEWKLVVAASEMNAGMRRLMQGTPWYSGGWKDVLSRLPGAVMGQQRVDGMSQKVLELCLTSEMFESDMETGYELPEAA